MVMNCIHLFNKERLTNDQRNKYSRQHDTQNEGGCTWTHSMYSGDSVCWKTTADRRTPWGSNTNSSSSFPDKIEKEKGGPLWKESLSVTTSCKMLVPTGLFSCAKECSKKEDTIISLLTSKKSPSLLAERAVPGNSSQPHEFLWHWILYALCFLSVAAFTQLSLEIIP